MSVNIHHPTMTKPEYRYCPQQHEREAPLALPDNDNINNNRLVFVNDNMSVNLLQPALLAFLAPIALFLLLWQLIPSKSYDRSFFDTGKPESLDYGGYSGYAGPSAGFHRFFKFCEETQSFDKTTLRSQNGRSKAACAAGCPRGDNELNIIFGDNSTKQRKI